MAEIAMQAKFPGTCIECFESIRQGDAIFYLPDKKKAKHRECKSETPALVKKVAQKGSKTNPLRKVQEKVESTEGKAAPKPAFRRFTVTEIMKLLPAFRAFNDNVEAAGFRLDDMDEARLAELFRITKNANFKAEKEEYEF